MPSRSGTKVIVSPSVSVMKTVKNSTKRHGNFGRGATKLSHAIVENSAEKVHGKPYILYES